MNIRVHHPASLLALCAAAVLAACGAGSQRAGGTPGPNPLAGRTSHDARVATTSGTAPDAAPTPRYDTLPPDTLPRRYYYELGHVDWYRHGQPLEVAGQAYRTLGPPISLSTDRLRADGRYKGVTYYVRRAGGRDTVYVPVYPNYWLRFVHRGAAATAP